MLSCDGHPVSEFYWSFPFQRIKPWLRNSQNTVICHEPYTNGQFYLTWTPIKIQDIQIVWTFLQCALSPQPQNKTNDDLWMRYLQHLGDHRWCRSSSATELTGRVQFIKATWQHSNHPRWCWRESEWCQPVCFHGPIYCWKCKYTH